jgi:hypothetical protein
MSDLRTRIAAAIYTDNGFGWSLYMCEEAADAVIAELGLSIERGQRSKPDGPLWGSNNRYTVHRWVTGWKADDE